MGGLQFQKFPELDEYIFQPKPEQKLSFGFSTAHAWLGTHTQVASTPRTAGHISNVGSIARR
jgi:hypothetical protein